MPSPGVAGIPKFQGVQAPPSALAASFRKDEVPADSSRKGGTPAVSQRKPATKLAEDLGLPDFGFGSDSESVEKTPTQRKVPARCAPLFAGFPYFHRMFDLETRAGTADSSGH